MPPYSLRNSIPRLREEEEDDLEPIPSEFTVEYLAAVKAETHWGCEEDLDEWTARHFPKDVKSLLLKGLSRCPVCRGGLKAYIPIVGRTTGVVCLEEIPCPCAKLEAVEHQLRDSRLISPRHAHACLDTLKPDRRSLLAEQDQQDIIDLLRAKPRANYLLWGDPGTGKTHFETALIRRAVEASAERCAAKWNRLYRRCVYRARLLSCSTTYMRKPRAAGRTRDRQSSPPSRPRLCASWSQRATR